MTHSVSDKLLGTEGAWVPVHREMARVGRRLCSSAGEALVFSVVLELWQEQQAARPKEKLSDRVLVAVREVQRDLHPEGSGSRITIRRRIEKLVRSGVLEDTDKRTKMGERVLSLRPVLDALSASTGSVSHPGAGRTPQPPQTGSVSHPGGGLSGTRGGVYLAPGNRVSLAPPSRETSPSYSEGEERSESPAGDGRAGPEAQPSPAIEEGEWLSIERALRRQRDAALARTTHRNSLTVLLARAEKRDPGVLGARPVAMALREARAQQAEVREARRQA